MKKSVSTDFSASNLAKVLEILTEAPKTLSVLSKSVSKEKWNQPLSKGERTPTEVLAHILNSEARSSEMIYQALLVNEPYFVDIHPERDLGKLLQFELLDFSELLAYFNTRRKVLLQVLSNLKEKDWERVVREESKQRKESIYWKARSLALHEAEHVGELEEKLSGEAGR